MPGASSLPVGSASPGDARPIAILVAALGGQGGGVLAEWIVDAATRAGFVAQSTSIPGVAQRTGATTYYVEIHPVPRAALGSRRPVLSLLPVPGGIDLFVASELLEAGRVVAAGMTDAARTITVASTSRTLTTAEKMALGDGRFASDRLLAVAREHARCLVTFDMDAAAREAGTVVSAVMFGAIAGTGVLPFDRDACEAVIREARVGVAGSLRGFALGRERTLQSMQGAPAARDAATDAIEPSTAEADAVADLPAGARSIAALGLRRVVAFQDDRYGALYRERLARIAAAERACDPREGHAGAVTRETARFLALWMAFDDVVRVAGLKCRASRFARVRAEVGAVPGDVVRIVDHFRPGVPEVAGLLPPRLARVLLHHDARRRARGLVPWSLALHVRADGIAGFLALRLLAGLRWLRPHGQRYADEQAAIERWLRAVEAGTRADWRLGYELALCGRLVKGYGATHARGQANLAHLLATLAEGGRTGDAQQQRAEAVASAREAALADEGGSALDAALAAHGAAPRPVRAQPIAFARRRPTERR